MVASTTALVHQGHTAHRVNALSNKVSLTLFIGESTDKGIVDRINGLEEEYSIWELRYKTSRLGILWHAILITRGSVLLLCHIMALDTLRIRFRLLLEVFGTTQM